MTIFFKYNNFVNYFFLNYIIKFSNYININNYIINLIKNQQPYYQHIYSLKPMKLEFFKIYIRINLVKAFIKILFINFIKILFKKKFKTNFKYIIFLKVN